MLKVVSDTRSDGIYTQLVNKPAAYTRELDHDRIIDYAADGTPVGIDLLGVSEGIEFSGLPSEETLFDQWLDHLAEKYRIDSYSAVYSFLKTNPFLMGILLEAPAKVEEFFGPDGSLGLEVFTDPEDDDSQELFILIRLASTAEDALSRLANLDREWWLEASSLARCLLNVDIQLIEPAIHEYV